MNTAQFPLTGILVFAVIQVITIVSFWQIFSKAGRPGWAALIPFYNIYVYVKVCGKSGFWFFLVFVPTINGIFLVILALALARKFEKNALFALGVVFLWPIFLPILAFDKSEY